jgi:uncharacterized protein with HEPN domain
MQCCQKIIRYVTGMDQEQFEADEKTMDAVLRNLGIIGEAANYISDEAQAHYTTVEWRRIIALRNIVVHRYFGIDIDIIWDIVQHRVPELLEEIQHILEQEQSNQSDAT